MRSDEMNEALDLLPARIARFDRPGVQRYMGQIQTPEQAQAFAQLLLEHPKETLSRVSMPIFTPDLPAPGFGWGRCALLWTR